MTYTMRLSQEGLRQSRVAVSALVSYTQPQNALKVLTSTCHLPVMEGNFAHQGQTMLFAFYIITRMGGKRTFTPCKYGHFCKERVAGTQSLDVQNKGIHIPLWITDQGRRTIDLWWYSISVCL